MKNFYLHYFIKDIETPKAITPAIVRPRITQKSGMIIKKKIFILSFLYFRRRSNAMCTLSINGTSSGLLTMWSFGKLRSMRS